MIAGMESHLYSKTEATVRCGSELCSEELQFLQVRQAVTRKAMEGLTGLDLSADVHTPCIQICASGGGYRNEFVATLGAALIGMEEFGLVDAVTAMSGLWAMAAWCVHTQLTQSNTRTNQQANSNE